MFVSCSNRKYLGCINFYYVCCAKSMECTSLIVKIGIDYPQAIIRMKQTKFTVLYTATMKGGEQVLKKSSEGRKGFP